jgi:hypothetical protein
MRKRALRKKIKPSDLRREAAAMIRDGSMPSLDSVLQAVADVREKYSDQIRASRKQRSIIEDIPKTRTRKLPEISSVVRVGGGRGFIVQFRVRRGQKGHYFRMPQRNIITAAHCLPRFPPAHAASYLQDRTYANLIGVLGEELDVWAECLFVDPIADIAVLGCPDNQELSDEAEAYEALTESVVPLAIGETGKEKGWLFSLDQPYRWNATPLNPFINSLFTGPTLGGMSGSPVLNARGQAIAVVVIGSETVSGEARVSSPDYNGPQPLLTRNLPGWLLEGANF